MKFNEEAFEGTIDIVAAAMEETEVELSAKGGQKVAEFFEAIYKRLAVIAGEEDDEDEDEGSDEDENDEEDDGEEGDEESDEDEDDEDGEEKSSAARTGSFEIYVDSKGKFRFRMKAANGQTIAVSQAYKKKESCLKGIESVKKNADGAVKEI